MYYAPAVSPDESRVAYLKRSTKHRSESAGGLLAGIGPMYFEKDHLFLCVSRRDGSGESCSADWQLPLKKITPNSSGWVLAELGWADQAVLYRICLLGFDPSSPRSMVCRDPGGKEGFEITNLPPEAVVPAPATSTGWQARVEPDLMWAAFPRDNKIIVAFGSRSPALAWPFETLPSKPLQPTRAAEPNEQREPPASGPRG